MEPILAFLRQTWASLKEYWQNKERKDRVRFVVISGVALLGVIIAIVMLTRTEYATLFNSTMGTEELGKAEIALTGLGVKHKYDEDGNLMVPSTQLKVAAAQLAEQNIPSAGNTYSWIMQGSGFSTSESEKRTLARIQAQDDIRTNLLTSPQISDAYVEIAVPENSGTLFQSEKIPVTASVRLTVNSPLSAESVNGIITYTAASYQGLLPGDVVVVDQNYNILNTSEPTAINLVTQQNEYKQLVESDLVRKIYTLLQPIFGASHVKAQVDATIDFDDKTAHQITLTPVIDEDGITVSMRRVVEKGTGAGTSGGTPGVDENGGDIPEYPETGTLGSTWSSTTEEINYDFNSLVQDINEAQGKITNLTASIIIDANDLAGDNESVSDIQAIVAGTIGLERADYGKISVFITPLQGVVEETRALEELKAELRRQQIFDLIKVLALYLVLGACLFLLIYRIFKFFHVDTSEDEMLELQGLTDMEEMDEYADLLKLAVTAEDIETTKTPERMKVEDFVDRNPDMVANLLRNWLSEDSIRGRR